MKKLIVVFVLFAILIVSVAAEVQIGTIGAQSISTYEGCKNKVFGLVGASNTAETWQGELLSPSMWMTRIIEELCPGSKVFLSAEGSTWPGAQIHLVNAVLQNENLDYVILNPSANGQQPTSGITPEQYKAAAINLAQIVKNEDPGIEVIMLTNTPTKGAGGGYGNPETIQRIKAFNADLLNNHLGVLGLIDHAVDTYSATEDGSDSCGRYCPNDNLHFGPTGRRLVVKAILNEVFGPPSTPFRTTASTPQGIVSKGCSSQRCKEIDEVWIRIAKFLATTRENQVWDKMKGWVRFDELYAPKTTRRPSTTFPSQTGILGPAVLGFEIDNLRSASPGLVKAFIRVNLGEQYIEDIDYLTRVLYAERGCTDKWKQERGAIAQVAINRIYSNQWGNTIKNVVASNSWNGGFATKIPAIKGLDDSSKIDCTISALKFMMSTGLEDIGAKRIGGREYFSHWCTLRAGNPPKVPPKEPAALHKLNAIMAQPEAWSATCENPGAGNVNKCFSNYCGAHFAGQDPTPKPSSIRLYKGGSPSSTITGGATVSAPGEIIYLKNSVLQQACRAESLKCVIPQQNIGKQEQKVDSNCRKGMKKVGNICIDQYEAMLMDANTGAVWSPYCNPGKEISRLKAVSLAGVIPQTTINQVQAKQACENAGKRLCTSQQWLLACQGNGKRNYPYADNLESAVCNDESIPKPYGHVTKATVKNHCPKNSEFYKKQKPGVTFNTNPWMSHPGNNQEAVSLLPTGTKTGCKTPESVYDMVGNIAEWTADSNGIYRGGYFQLANKGCLNARTVHPVQYSDYSVGFRCCAPLQ